MVSGEFKSIGLVVRSDMQTHQDQIMKVVDVLERRATVLVHCLDFAEPPVEFNSLPLGRVVDNADLVISVGGDGTLLAAARALVNRDTPLLGINLGRLGFLADVSFDQLETHLEAVLSGRYTVEERFFIEGRYFVGDQLESTHMALNDVILHSYNSASMVAYEISSGGDLIHVQRSDGVIVTTPTGSTAYALSGGGPIMHPSLNTLAIVPICPHTLSNRPIVLPGDQPIELKLGQDSSRAKVSFDGQDTQTVDRETRILVTRYPAPLRLLHPEDYDYFKLLRAKLYWSSQY